MKKLCTSNCTDLGSERMYHYTFVWITCAHRWTSSQEECGVLANGKKIKWFGGGIRKFRVKKKESTGVQIYNVK